MMAHQAYQAHLDGIEPAPFAPNWPKQNTLASDALEQFLSGKSLTTDEFAQLTPSHRLSAVVFTLKALGWPIHCYYVPQQRGNKRKPAMIGVYQLKNHYRQQALAARRGVAK